MHFVLFQSLCRGQGPLLWLGPAVKEMHHTGGEYQNEPMGAEYHKMPSELSCCIIHYYHPCVSLL